MQPRALLAYPRFSRNQLLNYEGMTPFYPGLRAVMPPLGLLTFGAVLLARGFEVRLVDENVRAVCDEDLAWADAVFLSGMHPQRARLCALLERARAHGKPSIVGGPSANICPEYYAEADAVHQGEIGDATGQLLDWLDETLATPVTSRRREPRLFRTEQKTPLDEQPLPALSLIDPNAYIMLPIQFSVGCPYTCEFCDIPLIYGRVARLKSPARVLAELDQALAAGFIGLILFVDDNLIANRKAFRRLLGAVQGWQQARGHPFALTGEASLNIARDEDLLEAMRGARFTHLFLGVESPDATVLEEISKKQNTLAPVVESLRTIERHGIEVILGIIFGFDGDTEKTGHRMREFLREANAPLVYFNLLAALPKTPLWERLRKEGRLLESEVGDARQSEDLLACLTTNVRYRLDNELVVRMLLDTVGEVYSPREVYRRNRWNVEHVYSRQIRGRPPVRDLAELGFVLRFLLGSLTRVLVRIGFRADSEERREFWRFVTGLLRLRSAGAIESVLEVLLRVPPNTHHLIGWGRTLREDHARGAAGPLPSLNAP